MFLLKIRTEEEILILKDAFLSGDNRDDDCMESLVLQPKVVQAKLMQIRFYVCVPL